MQLETHESNSNQLRSISTKVSYNIRFIIKKIQYQAVIKLGIFLFTDDNTMDGLLKLYNC